MVVGEIRLGMKKTCLMERTEDWNRWESLLSFCGWKRVRTGEGKTLRCDRHFVQLQENRKVYTVSVIPIKLYFSIISLYFTTVSST